MTVLIDISVVSICVILSWLFRFRSEQSLFPVRLTPSLTLESSAILPVIFLIFTWLVFLYLSGSWSIYDIGTGPEEYKRILSGSIMAFSFVVLVLFAMNIPLSRVFVFLSFFAGIFLLLVARWLARRLLTHIRKSDSFWSDSAVLIGNIDACLRLNQELVERYQAGFRPIAIFSVGNDVDLMSERKQNLSDLQILNGLSQFEQFLQTNHVNAVVLAEGGGLSPKEIRDLSWLINPREQTLIFSQALFDVSGPRIHSRPVAGLPLLYVEVPSFMGFSRFLKRFLDILLSTILLLIFLPIFLIVGGLIIAEDKGPVFFKQERIGRNGKEFKILKFRSMSINAEKQKNALINHSELLGNGPLFKLKSDPRVTKIGKFLRKWSIDELPQLINVLFGQMSLVGPRPPLESEVRTYEEHVARKFLVKPGITGLWQVSGRSDLSWETSVQLDLYYVENWSIILDLIILARTFKAVFSRQGSY